MGLTKEERAALPLSAFAVPRLRLLPLVDEDHVKMARPMIQEANGLTGDELRRGQKRILRAASAMDLRGARWDALHAYAYSPAIVDPTDAVDQIDKDKKRRQHELEALAVAVALLFSRMHVAVLLWIFPEMSPEDFGSGASLEKIQPLVNALLRKGGLDEWSKPGEFPGVAPGGPGSVVTPPAEPVVSPPDTSPTPPEENVEVPGQQGPAAPDLEETPPIPEPPEAPENGTLPGEPEEAPLPGTPPSEAEILEDAAEYGATRAETLLDLLNDTTRARLEDAIAKGEAAGEDIETIVQRVIDLFDGMAERRAPGVAATESTRAGGAASASASKQVGVGWHSWLSMRDDHVRDTHGALDGQTIRVGRFFVSPSGATALHPGGFGVAEEDCGCRCVLVPKIKTKLAAAADLATEEGKSAAWHHFEAVRRASAEEFVASIRDLFAGQKAAVIQALKGDNQGTLSAMAAPDWKCGAARDLPTSESETWDGAAAAKSALDAAAGPDGSIDPAKARRGFLIYDAGNPGLRDAYKEPFASLEDGKLVVGKAGIRAAASRLPQVKEVPTTVIAEAHAVIQAYEAKLGMGSANAAGFDPAAVDQAASGVELDPSGAQKSAGNYAKGHVKVHGLDMAIENVKGWPRSGVGADGKAWSVTTPAHYGYLKKTTGADGEHVDAYLGDDPDADDVHVVDQQDAATGQFDEHKAMIGFPSRDAAIATYDAGFSDGKGPQRRQAVTTVPVGSFKTWLDDGDTAKPFAPQAAKFAPAGMSMSAMSLSVPDTPGHVNKHPFAGVLTRIGSPSDNPPEGSDGKRVIITREAAEKALPTLLGMGVDYKPGLAGHDPTRKIGIIDTANIVGDAIEIAGFLYAADFPQQVSTIHKQARNLGFSWELMNIHVADAESDPWVITECTFTGAAILQKDKAAYTTTSLSAAADMEIDMATLDDINKALTGITERLGKLEEGENNEEQKLPGIHDKVKAHSAALRACADAMEADGIGCHASRGHVNAVRKIAAHMDAESAKGVVPGEYSGNDLSAAAGAKTPNPEIDALKEGIASITTMVKDMQAASARQATEPARKTLTPAISAALAKTGFDIASLQASGGKISLNAANEALDKAGISGTEAMRFKSTLRDAGLLELTQ